MKFKVVSHTPTSGKEAAFLRVDNWDDWGKYRTMFDLFVFDREGKRHDAGSVKIGQRGLKPSGQGVGEVPGVSRTPFLPAEFDSLDDKYFSLGQNETYYEVLYAVPDGLGIQVLEALRDCARDLSIFRGALDEDVMGESLLRSVSSSNVSNRFHRLINGDPALTRFRFKYTFAPNGRGVEPPEITFAVEPNSEPPTNIHVLIGRNGVGKTRCLKGIAHAILTTNAAPLESGAVYSMDYGPQDWGFSGLVAVSFSAFENFELPDAGKGMRKEFIGLNRVDTATKYAEQFRDSLEKSRSGPRRDRYLVAISTLENDPLFAEASIGSLLEQPEPDWRASAIDLFDKLSSGHKVVLLTVTRLVELVDENTIVLIDEPEGHLHPPLLSAFVRALSDLLIKRNGVAIISTHSPVVLQEVPRSCAWILRRVGWEGAVARPTIESFGENVGTLTREVFGLEVANTGFHKMLSLAASDPLQTYDSISAKFENQLGAEAKAMLRSLLAQRDQGGQSQ